MLSALLASAAKARLRERVRNQHKAVTMLTGQSWATFAYPFHPAWLPPLNYSLQSAAFNQRGVAGMAHGVTPTRLVLPIGYSTGPLAKGKGDAGSF